MPDVATVAATAFVSALVVGVAILAGGGLAALAVEPVCCIARDHYRTLRRQPWLWTGWAAIALSCAHLYLTAAG